MPSFYIPLSHADIRTYAEVQALTMECDGHELFRESNQASAVVVLISKCLGLECHLPLPEELRPALKGQRSLEDSNEI